MTYVFYLTVTLLLASTGKLYLRLARRFGIVDMPNERSMHHTAVVRGGGILIWIAALLAFLGDDFTNSYAFAGLTLVAAVSFMDDIRPVSVRARLLVQVVAVGALLSQTTSTGAAPVLGLVWLLVGVGTLNAWNFMDGINGMTALHGLVTVATLWLLSTSTTGSLYPLVSVALLVFAWSNVRRQAICFAGDVGSISVGFIALSGIIHLIDQKQSYLPLLLLAVYGVDTTLTIGYRLWHRQAIFQAHRLHLFQLLVHQGGLSPVWVSALYAIMQAGVNALVWWLLPKATSTQGLIGVVVLTCLMGLYGFLRIKLAHKQKKSTQLSRLQTV